MGRIADALKRAEDERQKALRTGQREGGGLNAAVENSFGNAGVSVSANVLVEPQADDLPPAVEGLSESLVPFYQRSSIITEQYRSLRTRLLSQNPHYEHRILGITSAIPKEGKSVTTLNLACTLAEIKHLKILAVDGDFRRGSLARMLRQPDGPGLAEVLSGEANYSDVIQKTPIPNLMVLPAGRTKNRSAAELLASAMARPLFTRLQNEFHYTIVDTPPATTVTDVGIVGQLCTGVIVVVRLNRTDDNAAKRAVRHLQVNNVPILGCLLIGRDSSGGRFSYGYGYTSYYRYYNYNQSEDE